jgi:hypothetical protein
MASHEHAYALVRAHGEPGRTGRPVSLTMDGLIYATSIVMLDLARRKVPVRALARWLLGLGIAATLTADMARGPGDGLAGAQWPIAARFVLVDTEGVVLDQDRCRAAGRRPS